MYLDDVIVLGETVENHLQNVRRILKRLRDANLKVNPEKSEFFKRKVYYLGNMIDEAGIHTDPAKLESFLSNAQKCNRVKTVHGNHIMVPTIYPKLLNSNATFDLSSPKKASMGMGTGARRSFRNAQENVIVRPNSRPPDFSVSFCLQTDASQSGLGVVLTQTQNDWEVVIAYASLTNAIGTVIY